MSSTPERYASGEGHGPASSSESGGKPVLIAGESELARLIRSHDWSRTPLGSISTWPQSLRTAVSLILNSQHPMWIGWGPEATFLYNDAYIQVLSLAKHPWALGRPAREVWAELWDYCGPLADKVFQNGEPTFLDDVRLFMNRGNYLEETYYSFSYSPILNDSGQVDGLFCPSTEVTSKVLTARRLRSLSELSSSAFIEKTVERACGSVVRTLAKNPDDVPFALLYVLSPNGNEYELQARVGLDASAASAAMSHVNRVQNGVDPFAAVLSSGQPQVISVAHIPFLPPGLADQPIKQAVILPVNWRSEDRAAAILVAGVNHTRPLDSDYRTFYDLVASHVATAISNARAYEEERERAERLTELDRAKTLFYSNVSHEFRTPLTLMLGPLEEILGKPNADLTRDTLRLVELAHRNGTRLLKLVNTLLEFSRIEAGRVKAVFQPTDLSSFTGELGSVFRSATDRAGLTLAIECDPLPEAVYVDREMWEKIVLNLVSNAFKFTFEGGIFVGVRHKDDAAELTVRDTGVGIPEAELPRIFDRFHRVEGSRGRSFEGSGIGLSLVQELVKLHGGQISVKSEVGKGTTFRVLLPYGSAHLAPHQIANGHAAAAHDAIAAPYLAEALSWLGTRPSIDGAGFLSHYAEDAAPLATSPVSGRESVLLVDDNRDMREYVVRLLAPNYSVSIASHGKEGLELALKSPPDLVLSDVMMPEMDGFELLAALRKNPATSTVPIILLSARAGEEARIGGLQQGADDYLIKPFSARELLARVESHLSLSRFRRETEKRIRESEQRFRALVSATSDAVYRMSPDWTEMLQLFGQDFISNTDHPTRDWLQKYIYTEDQHAVLDAIHAAILAKTKVELEHRVLRTDGSLGWVFSRAVPILDHHGEILEWFGAATDITVRKQAEQALLRSEKLASVGRMAATIAHEINNPLEAITNALFLAQTDPGISDSAHEYLKLADEELRRVAHISRQSLGFYRESNSPCRVSLNAILESTLQLLKNRIKLNAVTIERDWDGDLNVEAVAGELRQVFSNLITNSLDALEYGGTIKIRISARTQPNNRPGVSVVVADNGKGIPSDLRSRIFDAFFTTKGAIGTGLGLWVTRQIVEKHGGTIRMRSQSSGAHRGTSFCILLPTETVALVSATD